MSRKACALLAGWLAVVPAALAQTPEAAAPGSVKSKIRPLSPYFPTATTAPAPAAPAALPTGVEMSEQPPAMPDIMPRAPVGRMMAQQGVPVQGVPGMPVAPPMSGGTPVTGAPVTSGPPVAHGIPAPMPSAPSGAVISAAPGGSCGPNGCATGTCATGTCATAPTCNTGCGPCGPNGPCGPQGRAWVSAEYLYWKMKGMSVPPLVTGSTNPVRIDPVTGRPVAGTLADPFAVILNRSEYNDDWRSGFRVRGGFWLDECQTCGLEGSYFYLDNSNDGEAFGPQNGPGIFRPFFNADPNVLGPDAQLVNFGPVADAELVVFPNRLTGTVDIQTGTKFQGFDANFRKNLMCCCDYRVDFLAGYRYLKLRDSLQITENLLVVGLDPALGANQLPVGTAIVVQDSFNTQNEFNGGQVGLAGEWRSGRAYVNLRGLVALGNTNTDVTVAGFTRVTVPGQMPQTFNGGLLTQRTNIGNRTFDEFSVVPEAQATVGFQVTDGVRVFASYNYLYWSDVSRAGDQIDLVVDGRQINQTADAILATRPAPQTNASNFWVHGVSFGVELRY